jgi:hypothetical protein
MPLGLGIIMGLGHNVAAAGGGGGGGGATWAAATGYTRSGGNLIATRDAGSGDLVIKGSSSKASGTFTVGLATSVGSYTQIGLANVAASTTSYLGGTGDSIGYQTNGNFVYAGGNVQSTGVTYGVGDTITVIWDGTNVTFKKNGTTVGTPVDVHTTISTPFPAADTGDLGPVLTFTDVSWGA